MDWLSGWLKSIILIILLATFVDILLPSQTMQRYVKTVMSLFILLTLLQPLFSLFQKHSSVEELLSGAMKFNDSKGLTLFASGSKQGEGGEMQSLSDIQQQANVLKTRQEQQSEQLVQQQLVDVMKKSIEQNADVLVQNLQVQTAKDAQGQMVISQVKVTIMPQAKESQSTTANGTTKPVTVEPVKPVDIQIKPQTKADSNASSAGATVVPGFEQEQTRIRMMLSKDWQVPQERVAVNVVPAKVKS